jgi:hypothetical protein
MSKSERRSKYPIETNCFGPEEVRSLVVAFENTCAALPSARHVRTREDMAARIVSIAVGGERDATKIYLRCLDELQRQGVSVFGGPASVSARPRVSTVSKKAD